MYAINILCYLGFAPEIFILKEKNSKIGNSLHIDNGLFLGLLLALSVILFFFIQITEGLIFAKKEISQWDITIINIMDYTSIAPIYLWLFLFVTGLLLSFFNVSFPFPTTEKLLKKEIHKKFIVKFLIFTQILTMIIMSIIIKAVQIANYLWLFLFVSGLLLLVFKLLEKEILKRFIVKFLIFTQILTVLIVGIIIRAVQITNPDPKNATTYMLYENVLYIGEEKYSVPEWIFSLGFYPIAEISDYRWGKGSALVEPLSQESLKNALKNGRLIFIASHGNYGLISDSTSSKGYIEPVDVLPFEKGKKLQFVYLAGCNSGAMKDLWELIFYPAQVITFDRLSSIPEHISWLWFTGPKIVSLLK